VIDVQRKEKEAQERVPCKAVKPFSGACGHWEHLRPISSKEEPVKYPLRVCCFLIFTCTFLPLFYTSKNLKKNFWNPNFSSSHIHANKPIILVGLYRCTEI
jgi:hypothetical protein